MKKYLMTGIAAIAMCAAFTSCSHDVEPVSQEDLNQLEAQKIVNKYNQAFLKYVGGNIAANQTWGFGGYDAVTRGEYANANLWYKDYEVPANVTDFERQKVTEYFTNNLFENQRRINNVDFTDFFIYQVYKGTETYTNGYGSTGQGGSNKMNHLQTYVGGTMEEYDASTTTETHEYIGNYQADIKGDLKREHMNNFNAGDNQNKVYWDGYNDEDHTVIGAMLMINSGTADFSFHGSEDNKYHNTYVIIPGEEIDESLRGFWYVGFDYVATGGYIDAQGNLQNGNSQIERDWQFNDWIVRISPAERIGVDPDNVCIIAEDLSADGDTDFDFNDVVFTVTYTSASTATVTLYAAGGTLPLKVAGEEVHAKFGFAEPNENGLYKMINTGAKADVNGVEPVSFAVTSQKSTRGNDIEIMVDKGTKNEQGVHVPNWIVLTATGGEPAAKLCVGTDYATSKKWCDERESIKTKYPAFSEWVANSPTLIWWK